jgi:hypothetical protein
MNDPNICICGHDTTEHDLGGSCVADECECPAFECEDNDDDDELPPGSA